MKMDSIVLYLVFLITICVLVIMSYKTEKNKPCDKKDTKGYYFISVYFNYN